MFNHTTKRLFYHQDTKAPRKTKQELGLEKNLTSYQFLNLVSWCLGGEKLMGEGLGY